MSERPPDESSLSALPAPRGRTFGFHRAMDHAGAVLGPLLAFLCLFLAPGRHRLLFALTIVPGAAAVWMLTRVRADRSQAWDAAAVATGAAAEAASSSWRALPRRFYVLLAVLLAVLLVFTLGNSAMSG